MVVGLTLSLAGCTFSSIGSTPVRDVSRRTPTYLPPEGTTRAVVLFPTFSPPTLTPAPTPAMSKPGPPPGYVEPAFPPTPTVAPFIPASEWREIALPPPKGTEQSIPVNVSVPTIHLAIPEQWRVVNHPGAYFVLTGPKPAPPVLTLAPARPFDDWKEPIPQNMDEFTQSIVRVYRYQYGGVDVHTERIVVGGRESVVLFVPEGEVCVELFVPLAGRYDIVYQFTFTRSLCGGGEALTETGHSILKSIRLLESPD